jgi:hypothetical protein
MGVLILSSPLKSLFRCSLLRFLLRHLAGVNPSRVWLTNTVELYGNHVGAKGERLQPAYAS